MALFEGTIRNTDYDVCFDDLKTVMTNVLDFTCDSDTGSTSSRVMIFSHTLCARRWKIYYISGAPSIALLNNDDSAYTYGKMCSSYSSACFYKAIIMNNSRTLMIANASLDRMRPALSFNQAGVTKVYICSSFTASMNTSDTPAIKFGFGDVETTYPKGVSCAYINSAGGLTEDDKHVISPCIVYQYKGSSSPYVYTCSGEVEDVKSIVTLGAYAANTKIQIGTAKYIKTTGYGDTITFFRYE